jgi:hypothetical protein
MSLYSIYVIVINATNLASRLDYGVAAVVLFALMSY